MRRSRLRIRLGNRYRRPRFRLRTALPALAECVAASTGLGAAARRTDHIELLPPPLSRRSCPDVLRANSRRGQLRVSPRRFPRLWTNLPPTVGCRPRTRRGTSSPERMVTCVRQPWPPPASMFVCVTDHNTSRLAPVSHRGTRPQPYGHHGLKKRATVLLNFARPIELWARSAGEGNCHGPYCIQVIAMVWQARSRPLDQRGRLVRRHL